MKGLIIVTSTDLTLFGLAQKDIILCSKYLAGGKNTSKTLFPHLKDFCPLHILSYIAVGIGPGSYMGIRTAATIAQALSFALNIPLIEFSSPLAFLPQGREGNFAFIGDAKMGQLYVITGTIQNQVVSELSSPQLIALQNLDLTNADFVIGPGYLNPEPHLEWVATHSNARYIQENFSNRNALELAYLR